MNPPASLKRRFAALLYESLLIGAVTLLAAMLAGALNTFAVRLLPAAEAFLPLPTVLILLAGWWYYFKLNWLRERQTLPMRVWRIILSDRQGRAPTIKHLRLRFLWACVFIVFIPMLAYAVLRQLGLPPQTAATAALFWWILPWGFARFNPRRQFLYDYLAGTELIDHTPSASSKG